MRCCLRSIHHTSGALSTPGDCVDFQAGGAEGGGTHRRGDRRGTTNLHRMKKITRVSSDAPEMKTLLTGLAMGESPRWHDGRLWFSDWGAQEIVATDLEGNREVVLRVPFILPFSIDWLPDGRLVVVSGREGLLLRQDAAGGLVTHADLTRLSSNAWNEIVVDGRGNAYINTGDAMAPVTPEAR